MGLKGGRVGSVQRLRDGVTQRASWMKRLKKNEPFVVRFLQEPEDWFEFYEYYDSPTKTYRALAEGQILAEDVNVSRRYAVCVLDIAEDKTAVMQVPVTLAEKMLLRYERYGTLLDRDYELSRYGDGLNTKYDALPEGPEARKLDKYFPLPAVEEMIAATVAGAAPAATPSQPSTPAGRRRVPASPVSPQSPQPEPDPEPDDDFYTVDELQAMTLDQLRKLAVDNSIDPKGFTKDELVTELSADETNDEEAF